MRQLPGNITRPLLRVVRTGFAPVAQRFRAATTSPERAQGALLETLAHSCSKTLYGVSYGVRTAEDFRARLPITTYRDLEPWIAEQRQRESGALVTERVLFYEKTSGSTEAAKYIPYTASLRRSFARSVAIWAYDVLRHGPSLERGTIYFSVSPSFAHERATERGVPVGLEDDADYLGPMLKRALSTFFVSDAGAKRAPDAQTWLRRVARTLVARGDLEVISVWNPSLLMILLDHIEAERFELARGLGRGRRSQALVGSNVDWARLWPELKLVSCWASASAVPLARALAARLPHVTVQGKGLLATEAPLTIPLIQAGGFVPLVKEVFFELECVDTKRLQLLHQAELGRTYELIISQRGGLCRYRLGDRVRVTHHYGATPCLDFVGRGGDTSDLVGEKLQEDFVSEALRDVGWGEATFCSLVPVREPRDHYALLVDRAPQNASDLAARVDSALARAHHYAHARALGQLAPVRVVVRPRAAELVRDHHLSRGMKWGDIKHRSLIARPSNELVRELAS